MTKKTIYRRPTSPTPVVANPLLTIFLSTLLVAVSMVISPSVQAEVPFSATILSVRGAVDYAVQTDVWHHAAAGQQVGENTRLRTGDDSQAAIELSTGAIVRVGELSLVDLVPPAQPGNSVALSIFEGLFYFFSRSTPETVEILTPSATGAIRGTEFNLVVSGRGEAAYAMIEGDVELQNQSGRLAIRAGDLGTIDSQAIPVKGSVSEHFDELDSWLYYPAVLTPTDLPLTAADRRVLAASLTAYSAGNFKQALREYLKTAPQADPDNAPQADPDNAPQAELRPLSDTAWLYQASLKLIAGRVMEVKTLLSERPPSELTHALSLLIAAVTFTPQQDHSTPLTTASQWLALSYYLQSRGQLQEALQAMEKSLQLDSTFSWSWARHAELHFSNGRTREAGESLHQSLQLAPDNPLALSLKGFIDAADANRNASRQSFQQALAIDANFANGWLGDGLVSFSQGDPEAGLESLQLAAAMEPKRSLLRSYLGKGLAENGRYDQASTELQLANQLDSSDPTPLFYRSLLEKKRNQFNASADSMYKAIALNDNRNIYRSRLLLDQDLSVRNTNLAAVYQRLGMTTRAIRAASTASREDYSNYAAHRFMAESLAREQGTDLLRTEAAITNELLLANLLAPVQAGTLSQFVSNREYSSFFTGKRYGLDINAYVDEDRESVTEIDAYAVGERTSIGLDLSLGARLNFFENDNTDTDFDTGLISLKLKHQLSAEGSLFVEYSDYGVDVESSFFDGASEGEIETGSQSLSVGYRHHWGPGRDTLVLLGLYEADTDFDSLALPFLFLRDDSDTVIEGAALPFQYLGSSTETLAALEISHIQQHADSRWVSGIRLQKGEVDQDERLEHLLAATRPFFDDPVSSARFSESLERVSLYSYVDVQLHPSLSVIAALTYDWLVTPAHIDSPPSARGKLREQQWSPKLGLIWQAQPNLLLRAAFTRSLGGFAVDQGLRLEPTQVAGFIQTYRSLITTAPDIFAAQFETAGIGLQYSPAADLFFDLEVQQLQQDGNEMLGGFDVVPAESSVEPSAVGNQLRYKERSVFLQFNRLVGRDWSLGAQYGFVRSELAGRLTSVGAEVTDPLLAGLRRAKTRADLQQFKVFAGFNHPSGFFAELASTRYWPDDEGFNRLAAQQAFSVSQLKAGYRSLGQRWEIQLLVDNLENEEPLINDLVPTREIQGERTARIRLNVNL